LRIENYLKQIYRLSQEGAERISTGSLAQGLGVNAASVTEKIQRLAGKGLISYEKSRGVMLTPSGSIAALKVIRQHRIWESFLVKNLGFGWEEVHELAEKLEHIQSDELIERLEKHLNYPKFDPHGEPIPDKLGKVSKPCFLPLSHVPSGELCRIAAVKEDSPEFLNYFSKLGLSIGQEIRIAAMESYDNSLLIELNKKKSVHIGASMADAILVTRREDCCLFNEGPCFGEIK
jgi:DtxR family Mn-dependent transcriptional regulator